MSGATARCVVCGAEVPLANLALFHHVVAHRAAIYWTPVRPEARS